MRHLASPHPTIRLTPADAERYTRLRLQMLVTAPWAFDASPEDDALLDPAQVAQLLGAEQTAVFAIQAAHPEGPKRLPELVAATGVTRSTQAMFAHRARIWGVFVAPGWRGLGLGKAVMLAAIEQTRHWPGVDFLDLSVSANALEALGLYTRLGFEIWGREPQVTAYQGERYDEIYMTLRLPGN